MRVHLAPRDTLRNATILIIVACLKVEQESPFAGGPAKAILLRLRSFFCSFSAAWWHAACVDEVQP